MDILDNYIPIQTKDKTKPRLDVHNRLIIPKGRKDYKYFLEVKKTNDKGDNTYFIICSNNKFHPNCKTYRISDLGYPQLMIDKEIVSYIKSIIDKKGSIDIELNDVGIDKDVYIIY